MNSKPGSGSRTRRVLRYFLFGFLVLLLLIVARTLYAFRDRNPGYGLSLSIDPKPARVNPPSLRVGFGRVKINPDLTNPKRPVWIAGFSQHRAATAIHDDLWAIACVLDDGQTRIGIAALDAIGFFHDDVVAVRRRLASDWKIQYAVVCSTHNHSTPDLMGLWGPNYLRTGVDPVYREQVIAAAAQAFGEAVKALQPAEVAWFEIPTPPSGLVADTRKPEVFDPDIRVLHFLKPTNNATIGTIVGWGNHPETPWSKNTEITADYPGYLREALERGLPFEGTPPAAGLGGIHLFLNGAIGGLMSTTPKVVVHDPCLKQDFKEPSHDKARALGRALAAHILPRLLATNSVRMAAPAIGVQARTFSLPLSNKGYLAAGILGLLDRGYIGWKTLRTEAALITLGEASLACIPGEIYPEIVNGGIEKAEGGDFDLVPVEVPPIRELMPGKVKFVVGLANDEIGYIIPKSQWDERPPYTYGAKKPLYGEINSVGPEAAPTIHRMMLVFCMQARGIHSREQIPPEWHLRLQE